MQTAADMKAEQRQQALPLQRVELLDLQQAIVANQVVPIIHASTPRSGIPFSALND